MSKTEAEVVLTAPTIAPKRYTWRTAVGRLVKEKPLGAAGGVVAIILLLVGIFAGVVAPYGMNETWVGGRLEPPTREFLLGTDNVGRDLLSRVIYGARISVVVGLTASAIATLVSAVIGIASGYLGGGLDLAIQRFVDSWMCFPGLVILMILVSAFGSTMFSIIFALGLGWGIPGSRIIRGATISIKEDVYLKAARAIGCTTWRILFRHVLPNVMATLLVLFSIRVPGIVLAEASLSFLGFGIPPPFPSWGGMLSGSGRQYMFQAPWMAIWPGLALAITVYSINMFGDAVRDIVDPRMRGGGGRYGATRRLRRRNTRAASAAVVGSAATSGAVDTSGAAGPTRPGDADRRR